MTAGSRQRELGKVKQGREESHEETWISWLPQEHTSAQSLWRHCEELRENGSHHWPTTESLGNLCTNSHFPLIEGCSRGSNCELCLSAALLYLPPYVVRSNSVFCSNSCCKGRAKGSHPLTASEKAKWREPRTCTLLVGHLQVETTAQQSSCLEVSWVNWHDQVHHTCHI